MTILIAIYGAILSTIIALIQIREIYTSKRYVHVQVKRFYDLKQEHVEFLISNRSGLNTEVREIMLGNYGIGRGDFHMLWGVGADPYKATNLESERKIDLPVTLSPGETLVCHYSSEEAMRNLANFSKSPLREEGDAFSNLFYIEVEHSRANEPMEFLFEMDHEYLEGVASPWKKLAPLKERLRLWPVDEVRR